jgi:hypothetical protein
MSNLHPQYVTDENGNRISVLLPLEEFEALLEDMQDLQEALRLKDEPTVSWESVKAELGLE